MKATDIRLINENQGTGRVFFHTFDGKTIVRVMTSAEVQKGELIRKNKGIEAFKEYFVDLFNEKYSAPQTSPKPSSEDARLFELAHYAEVGALSPEQEEELQRDYGMSPEELVNG